MNLFEDDDLDQLLTDPQFRKWVLDPDADSNAYWQSWLNQFPEKREKLAIARELLKNFEEESLLLSSDQESGNIQSIVSKIYKPGARTLYWRWVGLAASVALILSVAWFYKPLNFEPDIAEKETPGSDTNTEVRISGAEKQLLTLEDGSVVILQPKSKVTYHISDTARLVFLEGEAYFEIAKKNGLPFVVKTPHLTTRVIGTSFRVKDVREQTPIVRVNTGKVEVSLNETSLKTDILSAPVLLSANQLVRYENAELLVSAPEVGETIYEIPLLPVERSEQVYKRTPLSKIFKEFEHSYGVTIRYDQNVLKDCSLTASLSDEPLTEKLRMICLGLNLSLEQISENTFVINGKGCR